MAEDNPRADIFEVVLDTDPDSESVSLTAGSTAVASVRDLLAEAAERSLLDMDVPASTVTIALGDFLDAVRVGQTRVGSYVLRFFVPVTVAIRGIPGDGALLGRSVTEHLVRSLQEAADGEDHPDFGSSVALARLIAATDSRSLRFRVEWADPSPADPSPPRAPAAITMSPAALPRLLSAIAVQRERLVARELPPVARYAEGPKIPYLPEIADPVTVVGPVISLSRPEVVVRGDVEGSSYRIRVALAEADYYRAARAHLDDRPVLVSGRLSLKVRTARVDRLDAFEVIES